MSEPARSGRDPKEEDVRRMLATPHPPVPADLALRAAARGVRIRRSRRALHRLGWLVVLAAVCFLVRVAVTDPWSLPAPSAPPAQRP